jgi:hypothetical protein
VLKFIEKQDRLRTQNKKGLESEAKQEKPDAKELVRELRNPIPISVLARLNEQGKARHKYANPPEKSPLCTLSLIHILLSILTRKKTNLTKLTNLTLQK